MEELKRNKEERERRQALERAARKAAEENAEEEAAEEPGREEAEANANAAILALQRDDDEEQELGMEDASVFVPVRDLLNAVELQQVA